jgi:hypothetical protein
MHLVVLGDMKQRKAIFNGNIMTMTAGPFVGSRMGPIVRVGRAVRSSIHASGVFEFVLGMHYSPRVKKSS